MRICPPSGARAHGIVALLATLIVAASVGSAPPVGHAAQLCNNVPPTNYLDGAFGTSQYYGVHAVIEYQSPALCQTSDPDNVSFSSAWVMIAAPARGGRSRATASTATWMVTRDCSCSANGVVSALLARHRCESSSRRLRATMSTGHHVTGAPDVS